MVGENHRLRNPNRVVPCRSHPGLLEMKARNCMARLFFFCYESWPCGEIVVCTGGFWKKGGTTRKKRKQDEAMQRAEVLMKEFPDSREVDASGA